MVLLHQTQAIRDAIVVYQTLYDESIESADNGATISHTDLIRLSRKLHNEHTDDAWQYSLKRLLHLSKVYVPEILKEVGLSFNLDI